MTTESSCETGALVIRAGNRLDSANAREFHHQLGPAIETARQAVIVDMEELIYISSAGLRVILQVSKQLERHSVRFAICSLSKPVREVFEVSGFDRVIDIRPSRADALAAVNG